MRTVLNKRNEINEGLLSRGADMVYAIRFLKLLVTPFKKTEAFKQGLVDENGYRTEIPIETNDQRSAFTIFHRLVFNVKRLLGKVPGGKSTLGSYAAALFLIKENSELSEEEIKAVMSEVLDAQELESLEEATFKPGNLKLKNGDSVKIQMADIKVINALMKGLNPKNRKEMEATLMKDKKGFQEILDFAKEAI